MSDLTPRIYVACLASYNAGRLYGCWIDLGEGIDEDDIRAEVSDMLSSSPEPIAEEWRIDASEDLDGYCPESLAEAAALGALVDTYGKAAIHWFQNGSTDGLEPDEWGDKFTEEYQGHHDSPEAFIENLLEENGLGRVLEAIQIGHSNAWAYLDAKAIAHDWMISDYFDIRDDGGHYIYRR